MRSLALRNDDGDAVAVLSLFFLFVQIVLSVVLL